MASRRAKFVSGLPPPWLAATMIARPYFVKIAARLASLTPLWCLIPAQCECPDIVKRNNGYSIRNQEKIRRKKESAPDFFGKCRTSEGRFSGTQGIGHLAQIIAYGALRKFHYHILDAIRIRHPPEYEAAFFPGGLYLDIAVIEHGRDDAGDGRRDVLDAGEVQFAYVPYEQPALFDVDDALIGDDPDIEVIIDPGQKTEKPDEYEQGIFHEQEQARVRGIEYLWEQERKSEQARDEEERQHQHDEKVGEDIEPVAMDDMDNFFIRLLTLEMRAAECVRHTGMISMNKGTAYRSAERRK